MVPKIVDRVFRPRPRPCLHPSSCPRRRPRHAAVGLFVALLFVLAVGPVHGQLDAGAADDLTELGFDDAQISVAGSAAFYIRSVSVDGSYYSFRVEADDSGVWRIVEAVPEEENTVPREVFLDLAVVTPLDATTLEVDGIVYNGDVLQGTLSLTDDAALTLAGTFSSSRLPAESLERVSGLRDILFVEEREDFEDRLAELRAEYEEQISRLQTQRATLLDEREALRQQAAERETQRLALEEQLTELEEQLADLRSANSALEAANENFAEANESARETISDLQFENTQLTNTNSALRDRASSLEQRIAKLQSDLADMREALAAADDAADGTDEEVAARIAELEEQVEELQTAAETTQTELSAMRDRNSVLEEQIAALNRQLAEAETENDRLSQNNANLTDTNASLREQNQSLMSRVEELGRRNEGLDDEVERLQRELADLRAEAAAAAAADPAIDPSMLEGLLGEETFVSEAGTIRNEIGGLTERIATLQSEIRSLGTRLEDAIERSAAADAGDRDPGDTTDREPGDRSEPTLPAAGESDGAELAELRRQNRAVRAEVEELERENERLRNEQAALRIRVMDELLEDGVIAQMRPLMTQTLVSSFRAATTQVGDWNVQSDRARQTDPEQFFAKLTLPAPQTDRPTLYSFTARANGDGWVGLGIHILVSGVEARGYGLGKSLLVWLTRDFEEYRNDNTYLQLYRSNDDIDMGRVLDSVIEESIANNLDIEVLFEPETEYITIAVNGEEKVRYKTWFGVRSGFEVALRSLGSAEFRDLSIQTMP